MDRREIEVRGIVQGVGFRPFVHRLASELRLAGFVQNLPDGVRIEIEGPVQRVDRFLDQLSTHSPALARIDSVTSRSVPLQGERKFRIVESVSTSSPGSDRGSILPADTAICDQCLAELFDPANRRYRYPFINCTNCGPRLTIIVRGPYDRARTTMAGFSMCPECQQEYDNTIDRRFHAQPVCCAACGPKLEVKKRSGERIETSDPLALFAVAILTGKIGALKGLGGYHLVCDARNPASVSELRQRKEREEKPLAVMIADLDQARRLCQVNAAEQALLESRERPIVLLERLSEGRGEVAIDLVAPGNPHLGLMLPYTPLHYLLMDAVGGAPLVMTSGNRSDEPIAYRDDDALERLGSIADLFLTHNRPIHVRCDDSVTRVVGGVELPIRRSRGYAPLPIELPQAARGPLLAVGGHLKGAFALAADHKAFLSHHLGDLDHVEACRQFERDVALYEELLAIRPAAIVHDLHPDYASTAYAMRRGAQQNLPLIAVQHHHAHVAACMAERNLTGPVIGVAFDGTGLGIDQATGEPTVWGGEFLVADYQDFRRGAHLRNVRLPGGDRAAREPWRMAVSQLLDAGFPVEAIQARVLPSAVRTIAAMIAGRVNSPLTSSMGRLFDAVASLAGVRDVNRYEGQAAIELECLASRSPDQPPYSFELDLPAGDLSLVVDTRPMIRQIAADVAGKVDAARIARRFHSTVAEMVVTVCRRLRRTTEIGTVVLSGGVFMNAMLTGEVEARLSARDFRVYRHRLVPPNDGGICLGQLAVAAARMRAENNTVELAPAVDAADNPNSQRKNECASVFPVG